jgi:hypothetical protein
MEPADAANIERLCWLEDAGSRLRALTCGQGEVQREPLIGPRGDVLGERLVTHPGTAMLRRIGKEARELCAEFGALAELA